MIKSILDTMLQGIRRVTVCTGRRHRNKEDSLEMKKFLAYAFKCDMRLEEIRQQLNAKGPWQWIERDTTILNDVLPLLGGPRGR